MKTIGLIGGMSWESSLHYYRLINQGVRAARGGIASAPLLLHSFDFAEIAAMQAAGEWGALADRLAAAAQGLHAAGAEAICSWTAAISRAMASVSSSDGPSKTIRPARIPITRSQ